MTPKEKAQEIRHSLEGLPCPICTKGVPDNVLRITYDLLEDIVRERFDAPMDFNNDNMSYYWWEQLEKEALALGMEYYEDLEDEE